ncbi:stealth conserved region 3 domain-containing protein [Kitasatospora phosalacinea]|uniref:stealth conserved region 3 domain-containing protein n=1 Tax=Kitasatospora phosalacinea TaxID=2065 RepID=UPI0035DB7B95
MATRARKLVRRAAGRTLRAIGVKRPPAPAPAAPDQRRLREDALLAADPALVRHAGLLAEVRDDLLAPQAREANLLAATAALDAAGLDYLLIPDRGPRPRLAIRPGDRAAVLGALAAAFTGAPAYAELLGHGRVHRTVLAEQLPAAVVAHERPGPEGAEPPERVKGLRLFRPAVTSGRTLHYGPDYGCDLEFWDADDSSGGAVAAIDETPFGWWLPSLEPAGTVRLGTRDYPVAAPFLHDLPEDVRHPVDAVITWVDDADPAWRARRAEARARLLGDTPGGPDAPLGDDGSHRYRNRDELRYCLRSLAMYAPWIRRIHLVTDDQTPDWLDTEAPGISVVSHRDLLAGGGVFNSHAIETGLHRIPGLAEHFLYVNDDVFLGRPVRREDFFLGSGRPKVVRDHRIVPPAGADGPTGTANVYTAVQQNTRHLLVAEHGRALTRVLAHTAHPLARSLMADAERIWGAELAATERSAFRTRTDVAPITLALYHGLLNGGAVDGGLDHAYLALHEAEGRARLDRLLADRDLDVFCLADGPNDGGPTEEQDRAMAEFLQAYFPVPGPYERPVAAAGAPLVPSPARSADARETAAAR